MGISAGKYPRTLPTTFCTCCSEMWLGAGQSGLCGGRRRLRLFGQRGQRIGRGCAQDRALLGHLFGHRGRYVQSLGGSGRRTAEQGGNCLELKGQLLRQTVPVFRVPAGMVGGVHHPLAALGLELFTAVITGNGKCLVVGEQDQIGPFLDHGQDVLGELQLPAVVAAQLVRLLKLG